MEIKGLLEKLGLTQEEVDALRRMRIEGAMQEMMLRVNVLRKGGNMHRSDPVATAKRRVKNKAARKARKVNRGK